MKKYKVIALSVVGKSNKVFNGGQTVSEDNFEPGEADKKIEAGFLELIGGKEKVEFEAPKEKEEKEEEAPKSKNSNKRKKG